MFFFGCWRIKKHTSLLAGGKFGVVVGIFLFCKNEIGHDWPQCYDVSSKQNNVSFP